MGNSTRVVTLKEKHWYNYDQFHDLMRKARELYLKHHSTPKKLLKKELPDANYFWIYDQQEQLIGITSYVKKGKYLAMTERTILYPEYRGQGFGYAASVALEGKLKQKGFKKIICEVLTFNTPMIIIKIKQGFLIEGLMRNHDDVGIHQYYLGKEI